MGIALLYSRYQMEFGHTIMDVLIFNAMIGIIINKKRF